MTDSHPLLKFLAFAVVCLLFTGWIVVTIGNVSFEARHTYRAEFTDVQGLLVNDAVKISGVTIGKVTGLTIEPGGTALVEFTVRDDIDLHEDAVMSVRWRDVFGLRFLYVDPGRSSTVVEPEHRYPIEQTRTPADLGRLLNRLVPVMRALDPELQNQVLEALSEALVGREQEVQDLISEGASLTQAVASREDELARLLTNAADIMDAYASREQQLRGFLDSFEEVADTVAGRNDELENAIVTIADGIEELRRRVDANDEQLRGLLDEADAVTSVLAVNHDNLEDVLETSYRGMVSYHLISRIGQWFNIRAVGVSVDYETVSTERGAELPQRRNGSSSAASLRSFLGAPASTGGGG